MDDIGTIDTPRFGYDVINHSLVHIPTQQIKPLHTFNDAQQRLILENENNTEFSINTETACIEVTYVQHPFDPTEDNKRYVLPYNRVSTDNELISKILHIIDEMNLSSGIASYLD